MHDVRAEARGKAIDGQLQAALPGVGAEKIELDPIIEATKRKGPGSLNSSRSSTATE